MEWRVFVPLLSNEDIARAHVNSDLISKLDACVRVMEQLVPGDQPEEVRTDNYFVTCPDFGLKYRNGKKLEIKIRTHADRGCGCEYFIKKKLKKDPIHDQIEDILTLLTKFNLHATGEYREVISNMDNIEVHKQRKLGVFNNCKMEVCRITLPEQQTAVPRLWLSIALEPPNIEEAEMDALQAFFKSTAGREVLGPLSELLFACEAWEGFSNFSYVQPMVCGYPFWIKYVSGADISEVYQHPSILRK